MAEHEDADTHPEASLQQVFDQMADNLGLRLKPADPGPMPPGFVCVCHVEYHVHDTPPGIERHDDRQIRSIIRTWESLSTAERLESWRQSAYDPYIGVDREGLVKIDQEILTKWLTGTEYTQYQQRYPPCSPRKVKVTRIRIVYIGREHACATYRITERFANDTVLASNVATMLAKLKDVGWRIVVTTNHGWEEQPPGS